MIVPTITTIGIQCSKCGQLQFWTFSVFVLSHLSKESYYCTCGACIMTINGKIRGYLEIEYPCIYCGHEHTLRARKTLARGESLLELVCKEKGLLIGYIGPQKEVDNSCREMKQNFFEFASQLVNDLKPAEFDNFFIVYAIMERIGKMVEGGRFGCQCDSDNLAVDILPDRIEFLCEDCGAKVIIRTDDKEILHIIDSMGAVFFEENVTRILNDSYQGHN